MLMGSYLLQYSAEADEAACAAGSGALYAINIRDELRDETRRDENCPTVRRGVFAQAGS